MNKEKRDVLDYIEDIKSECDYLLKRSEKETFSSYMKNEDLKRSFVRSLEIIGEATKNIPDTLKSRESGIPWQDIIGMRNRITHEYFGIDQNIIWDIVKHDIPQLKKEMDKILEKQRKLKVRNEDI